MTFIVGTGSTAKAAEADRDNRLKPGWAPYQTSTAEEPDYCRLMNTTGPWVAVALVQKGGGIPSDRQGISSV